MRSAFCRGVQYNIYSFLVPRPRRDQWFRTFQLHYESEMSLMACKRAVVTIMDESGDKFAFLCF